MALGFGWTRYLRVCFPNLILWATFIEGSWNASCGPIVSSKVGPLVLFHQIISCKSTHPHSPCWQTAVLYRVPWVKDTNAWVYCCFLFIRYSLLDQENSTMNTNKRMIFLSFYADSLIKVTVVSVTVMGVNKDMSIVKWTLSWIGSD